MQFNKFIILSGLCCLLIAEPAFAINKKNIKQNKIVKEKTVKTKSDKPKLQVEPKVCKAELLIDGASGEVISEKNADTPLAPASMTKLMTTYVVMKRVAGGSVSLNDEVTISAKASKTGGSQVYLKEGEKFTLDKLIHALLIQSANDSAVAIAEHIAGSSDAFVDLMNQDAKELGMTNSEFHSPHGLPPGQDQLSDLVSAKDFGILSRALVKEFPQILEITSKTDEDFRDGEFKMSNHNKLLKTFAGCDGLKTGYYGQAGFSVTVTAVKNNSRVYAIVMGCNDRKLRDETAAKLLSQGLSQFKTVKLIDKGVTIESKAAVENGVKSEISLSTVNEVKASIRAVDEGKVEKKIELCSALPAPVNPETPCGELVYTLNDQELGRSKLVTSENVEKIGWVRGMFGKIDMY